MAYLQLYISGGSFALDPKYTEDQVRIALSTFDSPNVTFELRGGGTLRSRLCPETDWSLTDCPEYEWAEPDLASATKRTP